MQLFKNKIGKHLLVNFLSFFFTSKFSDLILNNVLNKYFLVINLSNHLIYITYTYLNTADMYFHFKYTNKKKDYCLATSDRNLLGKQKIKHKIAELRRM